MKISWMILKGELWKFGLALTFFKHVFKNSICYIFLLLFFLEFFSQAENGPEFRSQKQPALPNLTIVLCCIAAWIQPDISGCQQNFLVVWRWNQLRTILQIFECKTILSVCIITHPNILVQAVRKTDLYYQWTRILYLPTAITYNVITILATKLLLNISAV